MEVTLKKAAELSRAAIAAAKAVDTKKSFTLSAFSDCVVTDIVEDARKAFAVAVDQALCLNAIAYRLREKIAAANAAHGVDVLLTQVARIDEDLKLISAAVPVNDAMAFSGGVSSNDMSALVRKVQHVRTEAVSSDTGRRHVSDTVEIDVISDEMRREFTERSARLKRERARLKDQLTAINFANKITIDDADVAVLATEQLVD